MTLNDKLNTKKQWPIKAPFKARYKNRVPDPGPCDVLSIDWELRMVSMKVGYCRFYPSFDEIVFIEEDSDAF